MKNRSINSDESGRTYNVNKKTRIKTPMLRTDLCDYNEAYIVVTGKITVTNPNNNAYDKKLALKNTALFFSCFSKINGTLVENAEDLDVVMPMYTLLLYVKIIEKQLDLCGITTEMNQILGQKEILTTQLKILSLLTITINHLNKFWRTQKIPVINCEISLD